MSFEKFFACDFRDKIIIANLFSPEYTKRHNEDLHDFILCLLPHLMTFFSAFWEVNLNIQTNREVFSVKLIFCSSFQLWNLHINAMKLMKWSFSFKNFYGSSFQEFLWGKTFVSIDFNIEQTKMNQICESSWLEYHRTPPVDFSFYTN